jgi:hypothetical protein
MISSWNDISIWQPAKGSDKIDTRLGSTINICVKSDPLWTYEVSGKEARDDQEVLHHNAIGG